MSDNLDDELDLYDDNVKSPSGGSSGGGGQRTTILILLLIQYLDHFICSSLGIKPVFKPLYFVFFFNPLPTAYYLLVIVQMVCNHRLYDPT